MSQSLSTISSESAARSSAVPQRYLVACVFVLAMVCGLVAAVTVTVDPFGYFGFNRTGLYFNDERAFKLLQVKRYPHDALLFGDSRAAYIDPGSIASPVFFNAAFGGSTPDDALWFWEHYRGNAKLVVIGVIVGEFNSASQISDQFTNRSWRDNFRYALSFELLQRSFDAVARWRAGEPSTYNDNGSRNAADRQLRELVAHGRIGSPNGSMADVYGTVAPFDEPIKDLCAGWNPPPVPPRAPGVGLERIGRMAEIANARGAKLIVFVHPMHEEYLSGATAPSAQAVDYVCSLGAGFLDLSASYSDPSNYWAFDHTHYKPRVGVAMLAEILRISGLPVKLK